MKAEKYIFLNRNINELGLEKDDVGFIKGEVCSKYSIFFLRLNKTFLVSETDFTKFNISTTGDRFDYKICDRCYKYLNTEENFENNRIKKIML